jgi:uncharacterized membrane protein YdfJ with MMPL/SSD domain
MRLVTDIESRLGDPVSRRVATVATVSGTTVTLTLGGGSVVADAYLSSYTPVVGHVVLVLFDDTSIIVLGRLIGP